MESQTPTTVVVVDDEPIVRLDLREILESKGYVVTGEAGDGFEAVELCKRLHPALALLDIKMPLLDGLSAARIILEEKLAGTVMLITSYSDDELVRKAREIGVSGYVVKPFGAGAVIPAIEIALESSARLNRAQAEKAGLADEIERRKAVEKAKGLVMEHEGMTEQQAYDYIRQLSREKNLSMKRIAEMLLIHYGG